LLSEQTAQTLIHEDSGVHQHSCEHIKSHNLEKCL